MDWQNTIHPIPGDGDPSQAADPNGGMQQPQPGQPGQYPITTQPVAQQAPQQMIGQFPAGLIAALTQPQYLQQPSVWNPAFAQYGGMNAASSNAPTGLDQGLLAALSPQGSLDQIMQAFAPQAQSANKNLMQTLADFGIGGGQAVTAQQQLQGQLAASLGPMLAGVIQNAQGNQLQAGEFGVGNALQQALSNAGFMQNANQFNAGNSLQSALANQDSANAAGQFNANTANQFSSANTSEANQRQMELLQSLLQDYFAQMQINAGTVGSGQGAANQQAVNFGNTITTSDPFGQLIGALAPAAGAYFGSKSSGKGH